MPDVEVTMEPGRELKTWKRIRNREIAAARARGRAWTPYRPFLHPDERIGMARCRRIGGRHRGPRPSVAVSYSTALCAATVLCAECYQDNPRPGRRG